MPTTYRATLTEVGAALVADAIASGTTLTWAKMALGDGNGSAVTVDPSRTSLVNEQYRAPLNDLGRDSANPNTIVGTLVVPPETGGWTIREFGIYDNAATPRLVAYGETPEIEKPASSAGTGINLRLRFKLVVSAEANITLSPDSNEAYATIEYVKDNAVKSLSVSGCTITYTMGDGDTHTIRTQDTTYNDATQSEHGLMSAEDKKKLDEVPTTYVKKAGDTVSGAILSIVGSASVDGSRNRQFGGSMGSNDVWSISVGATASDAGFLEISTGDNGNEPIYVAQNNNSAGTSRRATLLDGSGNTAFPGTVTVGGLKISNSTIGSATKPVYVNAGTITAGTYELKKTVPADAVFTDTHWTSHLYAGASNGVVNAATTNGNTYLILCDNTTARDRRKIAGNGATSVTSDANGNITISSTNTVYTHPSYTARTGKPTGNQTPAFGGTFTVSQITSDASGHVTGATDRTVTIPNYSAANGTGYIKLANGKQITHQNIECDDIAAGATATVTVTFPRAFKNTHYSISLQNYKNSSYIRYTQIGFNVVSISTTSITICIANNSTAVIYDPQLNIIVIGEGA